MVEGDVRGRYRRLDAGRIVETCARLNGRIGARFPNTGLFKVAADLNAVAEDSSARVARIGRVNWPMRGLALLLVLCVVGLLAGAYAVILRMKSSDDLFSTLQGVDSGLHLLFVAGAAIFFLTSLETRIARDRALASLHELRSIVHVIDMHQLAKDPSAIGGPRTSASLDRPLTPFELKRYLDYCSELLSICGKIAALYAQDVRDPVVIEAVGDIERLTTALSQKIWQKITILQTVAPEMAAPASAVAPRGAA